MAKLAPRFETDTVRNGYIDLCKAVRDHGEVRAPRGQEVREVRGATVVIHQPWVDAMPHSMNRGLNLAIGAAEALQLLGGVSYPQLLKKISPTFARFMTGEVLAGAYGPRIRMQLAAAVERLKKDPDSRQTVVQIWDPMHDLLVDQPDVPCTLGFQFFINEDAELELYTSMRSNDLWLGYAYDIFQFAILQRAVASSMGLEVGPLVHRVGSLHLYARDIERVDRMELRDARPLEPAIALTGHAIEKHSELARAVLSRSNKYATGDRDGWFTKTLKPYLDA